VYGNKFSIKPIIFILFRSCSPVHFISLAKIVQSCHFSDIFNGFLFE
jgi:hypothetical protein